MSRQSFYKAALTILAAGACLSACSLPPQVPPTGNNLTLEMRRLQNSLTEQQQSLNEMAARLAELETRQQSQAREIASLQQGRSRPLATPVVESNALPGGRYETPAGPTATDRSPTEIYLQAFGNYASGRYPEAIRGFEDFLQRYPNNSYASNAQFWLADCYYNQQDYPAAIRAFELLLKDYPRTVKAPEALLKIATAQLHLGQTEQARLNRDMLQRRYPDSPAAAKAHELKLP